MGTLIDFSTDDDDNAPSERLEHSNTDPLNPGSTQPQPTASVKPTKSPPPSKPSKPLALRPAAPSSLPSSDPIKRKPAPPPPPPRPGRQNSSTSISTSASADTTTNLPSDPSPLSQIHNSSSSQSIPTAKAPPQQRNTNPPPSPPSSYRASVRNKVTSAYNSLPSWYPPEQASAPTGTPALRGQDAQPPPPVPPRRNLTSVPGAVAGYATSRLGGRDPTPPLDAGYPGGEILSKKEELWLRRWERAKQVFDERGVVLRSWRVGEDVADGCVRLVEGAMREQSRKGSR